MEDQEEQQEEVEMLGCPYLFSASIPVEMDNPAFRLWTSPSINLSGKVSIPVLTGSDWTSQRMRSCYSSQRWSHWLHLVDLMRVVHQHMGGS